MMALDFLAICSVQLRKRFTRMCIVELEEDTPSLKIRYYVLPIIFYDGLGLCGCMLSSKRFARMCIVELEDDPGRRDTLIHCTSYNGLLPIGHISAPQSKNAVSTNINNRRYIHLMSNFSSVHLHTKRLYVYMFDIVDTVFSYGRRLIVC